MRRLDWRSGEGGARAACLASTVPGGVGSPSVPTTGGCPREGWTREGRARRKPRDRAGEESAVRPRKHGPEAQNRRGGAPKGDAPGVSGARPARARTGGAFRRSACLFCDAAPDGPQGPWGLGGEKWTGRSAGIRRAETRSRVPSALKTWRQAMHDENRKRPEQLHRARARRAGGNHAAEHPSQGDDASSACRPAAASGCAAATEALRRRRSCAASANFPPP